VVSLELYTRNEFHAAVSAAVDAISQNSGWVVSHHFYSNALAIIHCQLPVQALPAFADALGEAGFVLHHPLPQPSGRHDEVAVQLSLNFLSGGPDIRRDVPAFG
jgi:hypothetical protein